MNAYWQALVTDHNAIRLGCFVTMLMIMRLWEFAVPMRELKFPTPRRWLNNLSVMLISTVLLRLLFPTAVAGIALYTQAKGWGLFNQFEVSFLLTSLICVVALDLVIYWQHRLLHAIPLFWRVHRMHHADLDFDVSTGVRFHPIEIILSMVIKSVAIVILGVPAVVAIAFEVLLSATALFNHANVRLPVGLDHYLRWVLVTPNMHRVHHSTENDETNHNFGFNLACWDRLFGTYRTWPRTSHEVMDIGIPSFRRPRICQGLWGMLTIPFIKNAL